MIKNNFHQKIKKQQKIAKKQIQGISAKAINRIIVCTNKRVYGSKEQAEEKGSTPYKCKECGKWHRATNRPTKLTLTQQINRAVSERKDKDESSM